MSKIYSLNRRWQRRKLEVIEVFPQLIYHLKTINDQDRTFQSVSSVLKNNYFTKTVELKTTNYSIFLFLPPDETPAIKLFQKPVSSCISLLFVIPKQVTPMFYFIRDFHLCSQSLFPKLNYISSKK